MPAYFYTSFSFLLEIIRVKYLGFNPATNQIVNYIPFLLAFGFGLSALVVNFSYGVYVISFMSAEYLLSSEYYGHNMPLYTLGSLPPSNTPLFSPALAWITLIVWISVFLVVSLTLFNRIYYRSLYEGRIV